MKRPLWGRALLLMDTVRPNQELDGLPTLNERQQVAECRAEALGCQLIHALHGASIPGLHEHAHQRRVGKGNLYCVGER